jgi:hypothetical protein
MAALKAELRDSQSAVVMAGTTVDMMVAEMAGQLVDWKDV